MKYRLPAALGLTIASLLVLLTVLPAPAATMSASATPPVIDGEDIANFGTPTGADKWWPGSATSFGNAGMTVGQTFRTGSGAVLLKAVTIQVRDASLPTKTYTIRVGTIAGTTFNEIASEPATQTIATADDDYWTWTLQTPVLLSPDTDYGVDIGLHSSSSAWQTGIPYVHTMGNTYPEGSRFRSGSAGNGVGDSSISLVSGERIFHLDLERPLGASLDFVAGFPQDDALGALIPPELIATFSQDLVIGSGSITIRNLTDSSDESVPITDSRISLSDNLLMIETPGLIDWNKSYAIRIDPGALIGDGGAGFAGISDDATWNFTTAAGDPLLLAIAELKDHITGTTTLSDSEIATHKVTIDAEKNRFNDSPAIITALFDLISTYDGVHGPIFVSGSTVTDFNRNNFTPGDKRRTTDDNFHWVVLAVMQGVLDEVYNATTLADPAKRVLLDGYLFGSSADFPGAVAIPGSPTTHTATVNASFPETFGRDTQHWEWPARKPTGTYLPPGAIATVTVPAALVDQSYQIRIGAHSWDHEAKNRPPVKRLSRATILYNLNTASLSATGPGAASIDIASPYGGGIYLEVPKGANGGVVNIDITGAVRSPYFSRNTVTGHLTTNTEWINTERNHPAPWADFQSEKFMMQVPTSWVNAMNDPETLMADWDKAMDAINDLMGFPRDRGKETMYIQTDVILRSSVHAPGYPATNISYNPKGTYNGYVNNYFVRGPGNSATASHIEFHEQGHAYRFPKFGGETESNVNLLQPAMLHRAFGYSLDDAQRGSLGSGNANRTLDNTAVAWMCVFNFAPRESPMANGEKAYQHKGHAKFLDLVRLFGWNGLDTYWRSFMEDDANGVSYGNGTDEYLLRLCRSYNKDIRPLFHFWGIHPQNPSALAAAIEAENIPPSVEIRDLMLYYKTLVPADNAAFRSFAMDWWGKKPSINGYWEEREHSRQWDQEALFGAGDQQRADITINEEYIPASADQIRARVDALVEQYFPDPVAWTFLYPGADLSDPSADLDGDGMRNGDERIWGLDPTKASSMSPVSPPPPEIDADFIYTRRDELLTGKLFTVWISHDLVNWTPDPGAVQDPGNPDANGMETVGVTLSPGTLASPSVFVRISAE